MMKESADAAQLLQQAMDRALGSWPGIAASLTDFARHARALSAGSPDLTSRGHELYLAFACSRGDQVAIRVLEREYIARAVRAMARVNAAREFLDDASQAFREHLLVGPQARIRQFAASGPLGAWLRVAALRTALQLQKRRRNANELLTVRMMDLPAVDVTESERYREAVQAAVDAAFSTLSVRERNVLRLSYVEDSSIDQIAALYGTHRATAARWISGARGRILDHVADALRLELQLSVSEIRSLLSLARSRLGISVGRLLRDERTREEARKAH
jgi:RNA polymerase sigma-70 factor (ECF subfamily)